MGRASLGRLRVSRTRGACGGVAASNLVAVLPRPRTRGEHLTLTVGWTDGVWEVRDGECVLSWAATVDDAAREARLLAAAREPCRIVIDDTPPASAGRYPVS